MSRFRFRDIDDNTDYMAKMNEAAARGDTAASEGYERDRNYKIDKLGLSMPKTYKYIDVGNEIKAGMENGAPGSYIKELDDYRINKANTTSGLGQFSNDEIHEAALRYHYNDAMGVGGQFQNRPVYNDKYGAAVDELFDRVMSGEKFSYDVESDPSYQSYKDMYTREGNRAMKDTLAQVAQNAGGNNSYAVSAAAQANNYYMQQLMDKVPELYNAAYNRYMNEENLKRQDLELAQMLQNNDYNKYVNDMGIFQTNVGLANDMANSQFDREYRDREWNHNVEMDEWNKNYMLDEQAYNRAQADEEKALEMAMTMIQNGYMPSDEALAAAGISGDAETWKAIANWNMYERMGSMPNTLGMTGLMRTPGILGANGTGSQLFEGMIPHKQLGIPNTAETEAAPGAANTLLTGAVPAIANSGMSGTAVPNSTSVIAPVADEVLNRLLESNDNYRTGEKLLTPGQAEAEARKNSGGGNAARYSGTSDGTKEQVSDYTVGNLHGDDWVHVQGFGRLSYQELERMVDNNIIKERVDYEKKKISYRKA